MRNEDEYEKRGWGRADLGRKYDPGVKCPLAAIYFAVHYALYTIQAPCNAYIQYVILQIRCQLLVVPAFKAKNMIQHEHLVCAKWNPLGAL